MTLEELSRCYEEAAVPLREHLQQLRRELAQTDDPEACWHLKRRIFELEPILTQMNELAYLLRHYYDRGGGGNDKDDRYGFNAVRAVRGRKSIQGANRETNEPAGKGRRNRTNRTATTDVEVLLHRWREYADDLKKNGD